MAIATAGMSPSSLLLVVMVVVIVVVVVVVVVGGGGGGATPPPTMLVEIFNSKTTAYHLCWLHVSLPELLLDLGSWGEGGITTHNHKMAVGARIFDCTPEV